MKHIDIQILVFATLVTLGSCVRLSEPMEMEDGVVRFTASAVASGAGEPVTRTSFGSVSGSTQNLLWTAGDRVSIWSPEAVILASGAISHPAAAYVIDGQDDQSEYGKATGITAAVASNRLQWGTAATHVFYGKYPDPTWNEAAPHAHAAFANQDPASSSFLCWLPGTLTVTPETGTYSYSQDMSYCYMTAYSTAARNATVDMTFMQAVSAFRITIPHGFVDGGLRVSRVTLSSASHRLNGEFTVNIGSSTTYAVPETSLTEADRTVSMEFATPVTVPNAASLCVTLFTCPVTVSDLTLTIALADGMTLAHPLKATGGDWTTFPAGKVFEITCGAVPEIGPQQPFFTFTVNAQGSSVAFSRGNLMAKIDSYSSPVATASEWKFGEPTEVIGDDPSGGNYLFANGSSDCVGKWVDLFSWQGASIEVNHPSYRAHGLVNSLYNADYHGGGSSEDEYYEFYHGGLYDGCWNGLPISNGGGYNWRVLNMAEWEYLLEQRDCSPSYVTATIDGQLGLVLFPDDYVHPSGVAPIISDNTFDAATWSALESAGCIFLPAAGYRRGDEVSMGDNYFMHCCYWASVTSERENAWGWCTLRSINHKEDDDPWPLTVLLQPFGREYGFAVRLVRDVDESTQQEVIYDLSLSGNDVVGIAPYTITMEGPGTGMSKTVTLTSIKYVDGVDFNAAWTAEYSSNGTSWSSTSPLSGFSVTASGEGSINGETVIVNMPSGVEDTSVYVRFSNAGKSAVLQVNRHINGRFLFTVNAQGGRVCFSPGNMQYIGSAATPFWKFADFQWTYFGDTTGQDSDATNVDRDLFGWGTGDAPNKVSGSSSDYASFTDWGTNSISNGGSYSWRTPTITELSYLLNNRTSQTYRYAKARVHDVNGLIIFPDGFSLPSGVTIASPNSPDVAFTTNTLSNADWSSLEQAGCILLPAAGYRGGTKLFDVGESGPYWSITPKEDNNNHSYFMRSSDARANEEAERNIGFSVRLVRDIIPEFSVSASKKVAIAPGNLQYTKSTGIWSFMEHPWDMVESGDVGTDYANQNVVSLFGWGTSGYGSTYPNMTSYPYTMPDPPVYGPNITSGEWTSDSAQWDWGVRNTISNGGGYSWRTLSNSEWLYLLNKRSASYRFAAAQVHGVNGFIIFPDGFILPSGVSISNRNPSYSGSYTSNTLSDSEWSSLEFAGCVFLPAAGFRTGKFLNYRESVGAYWSCTAYGTGNAYRMEFDSGHADADYRNWERSTGLSVRPVRDLNQ